MKRKGFLYPVVCDKDTIRNAIMSASKGKRKRPDVQKVLENIDEHVDALHETLTEERFLPSEYERATIHDGVHGKVREIFKPRFWPDQVVHWCIYIAIRPTLYKSMYAISCGSIPDRGIHYGKRFVERWVRRDRKGTKYYLKTDVRHYYPSIDKALLMQKLGRKFKDAQLMRIIQTILDKGDGLPIGVLLSQVFANFYLSDVDFFIKQELGVEYYIRYMDDMVIFGGNKRELHRIRRRIDEAFARNGLSMKSNWQVRKFDNEPLDFMGFRFYRDHTTIRKSIMYRITRKVRKVDAKGWNATNCDACAVISYMGWIKHTDSHGLFEKRIKPYLHVNRLKAIIRRHQREELQKPEHK